GAAMFVGGDLDYPVYLVVNTAVPIEGHAGNVQPVGTTASAGTSHKVAAADHVHTLANALDSTAGDISAVSSAQTASAGTSAKAARADHVHGVSGLQGLGTAGVNEIDSSGVNGLDNQSSITLLSQGASGTTNGEVDITAGLVAITGNITSNNITTAGDARFSGPDVFIGDGTNSNINLNPQMATPPNYPLASNASIANITACINGLVNSFVNHNMMS